jgi:hypothetical protein
MAELVTYWMYYTDKWQYAIEEVPGGEVEDFLRRQPQATQLKDQETIDYIERTWNECNR